MSRSSTKSRVKPSLNRTRATPKIPQMWQTRIYLTARQYSSSNRFTYIFILITLVYFYDVFTGNTDSDVYFPLFFVLTIVMRSPFDIVNIVPILVDCLCCYLLGVANGISSSEFSVDRLLLYLSSVDVFECRFV